MVGLPKIYQPCRKTNPFLIRSSVHPGIYTFLATLAVSLTAGALLLPKIHVLPLESEWMCDIRKSLR